MPLMRTVPMLLVLQRQRAVTVTATAQPGARARRLRDPAVDVSYDDRATWTCARLRGGAAVVQHPAADGFVSLRATAADTDGYTVTQTIVHACRSGGGH